jgi:hypothetical protein
MKSPPSEKSDDNAEESTDAECSYPRAKEILKDRLVQQAGGLHILRKVGKDEPQR